MFLEPLHPVGHHPAEFPVRYFVGSGVIHLVKSGVIHSGWIGAGPSRQCRPDIAGGRDQLHTDEQLAFHIHAHLAIYVNGAPKLLPPGIGIGPPLQFEQTSSGPSVASGSCFSWLHTHDSSGVVHIESPIQSVYTLGDFFDIWGQPLSATQVGPAQGPVTATVNGNPFTGDPRGIPLDAHNVIQLDVGSALPPPQPYTFSAGL